MSNPSIGSRIRAAREHAGFDKGRRFAEQLGIASETLSRYEHDRAVPRGPTLARIAVECGVTTDWLLTGQGEGPPIDDEDPAATGTDAA